MTESIKRYYPSLYTTDTRMTYAYSLTELLVVAKWLSIGRRYLAICINGQIIETAEILYI